MQSFSFLSNPRDPDLQESVSSLISESLERLIYATTAILYVWFFIVGQTSVELLEWKFWGALVLTILVIQGSIQLLKRRVMAANLFWLAGLFLITTTFVLLFDRPEAVFFYPLFALQAAATVGWAAGAGSVLIIAGLMAHLSGDPNPAISGPYMIATIASSAASAFLGWVTANTLISEVQNSTYFSRLARQNLNEAREHRGQLVKLYKDLDLAYYRLERANASLVAAWKEAENAERTKAELITYVSHEMRTPLNLLIGFSETILTSPDSYGGAPLPGPYREDLNKINQNARHLLALVDDVIDLSRANINRLHLTRETVSVTDLLQETAAMVRDYIQSKKLELVIKIDPALKIISADRLRLRQVLLNLLVNAARFTETGSIQLQAQVQDGMACFGVIDTGRGIGEKDLGRIFEEYYTDSPQSKNWHSGSGLGLPISKKLVELHGGKMSVESVLNQGTTFWFTIPLEINPRPKKPAASPFSIGPYQPQTLDQILVLAHPDPRLAATLQRSLDGLKVLSAGSQSEAAHLAVENHAVGILSPEPPDGLDLPPGINYIQCHIPGLNDVARHLGILDILEKPISPAQLQERLAQLDPQPRKILIIDDDSDIVQLFQRALYARYAPENLLGAYNGQEGLDMLRQERPDLVLLDLVMEGVSGYDILKEIQSDPQLCSACVIVISGTVPELAYKNIQGGLHVSNPDGWSLPILARAMQAMLKALTPGWQ